ncbi:MAG TPA: hypothetical protein VLH38_02625 [Patescibacteria group bacterium]|nr:hypothetical protein [Patescibacteria group bacterium]
MAYEHGAELLGVLPHVDAIEASTQPGRLLHVMASELVSGELAPQDVLAVLAPERGEQPRWQQLEDMDDRRKNVIRAYGSEVIELAYAADLRRDVTLPQREIDVIDPDTALFVAQDAANNTFMTRPGLATEAMIRVGLDPDTAVRDGKPPILYSVTSNRVIPEERNGQPNKERANVQALAPDTLDPGDTSEIAVRNAVLEQQGFIRVGEERRIGRMGNYQEWEKPGEFRRGVVHVDPTDGLKIGGLTPTEMGLRIIDRIEPGGLDRRQVAMGHNGQYRITTGLIIEATARRIDVDYSAPPVVAADEAGHVYSTTIPRLYGEDRTLTLRTGDRGAALYIPEFRVVQKMAKYALHHH